MQLWTAPATCALLLGVLVGASSAHATAIYQYTGHFYDTVFDSDELPGSYSMDMRVTGHFQVASPIQPDAAIGISDVLSLSFDDGRHTWDLTELEVFDLSTDSRGVIDSWTIVFGTPRILGGSQFSLFILNDGGRFSGDAAIFATQLGGSFPEPRDQAYASLAGTWTLIPEPSTALLLGLGLACLPLRRIDAREALAT